MIIALIGDLHGYPASALSFLERTKPDFAIQVGDFYCYDVAWPVPLHWIPGNHENEKVLAAIVSGEWGQPKNSHLCRGGEIMDLGGAKVVALPSVPRRIYGPAPAEIARASFERCLGLEGEIDIFFSHGCGFEFTVPVRNQFRNVEDPEITFLLRKMRPRIAVSGHNHWYWREECEGIDCIRLGRCDGEGNGWATVEV